MSSERAGPGESHAEILGRIENFSLASLAPETLERMDRRLASDEEAVRGRLIRIESDLRAAVESSDLGGADDARGAAKREGKRLEEVREERARIFDARQTRILEDRFAAMLGSRRRAVWVERFVLLLIFGVLTMLYVEFTRPLPLELRRILTWVDIGACAIFLAEFFARLRCAESKAWFWRKHWIDFVTSIPIPDLEALRFGRAARLIRLVRVLRVLRVFRVVLFLWRGMDKLNEVLDVKLLKRSLMLCLVVLLLGAAIIYWAEGGASEGVSSFGETLWWSFTTVVTGGYGDIHNPMTPGGRVLTVVLVISGMILVGIFTATLTSVLVEDPSDEIEAFQKEVTKRFERIEAALKIEKD